MRRARTSRTLSSVSSSTFASKKKQILFDSPLLQLHQANFTPPTPLHGSPHRRFLITGTTLSRIGHSIATLGPLFCGPTRFCHYSLLGSVSRGAWSRRPLSHIPAHPHTRTLTTFNHPCSYIDLLSISSHHYGDSPRPALRQPATIPSSRCGGRASDEPIRPVAKGASPSFPSSIL